jgi:hypothetical protein
MKRVLAAALFACGVFVGPTGAHAAMAPTIGAPIVAPATAAIQTGFEEVQWRRGGGWRRGPGFRRGPGWRRGWAGPPRRVWAGPRYVYAGPRFVVGGPVCRTVWVQRWRPRLGGWVTVPVRRCRY